MNGNERIGRILAMIGVQELFVKPGGIGANTQILNIARAFRADLIGNSADAIEISQWLSATASITLEDLRLIDQYLLLNTFIVGNRITLADIALYDAVLHFNGLTIFEFPEICRWIVHIANLLSTSLPFIFGAPKGPTIIPNLWSEAIEGKVSVKTQIPSSESPPSNDSKLLDVTKVKKEKKVKQDNSTPAPIVAVEQEEELDPSKLDIRVGLITKCWNHPESDKLLCEEIDVGEASVRSIASGLRAHYSAEQMQGRKVLVLANLKERPMAGFKSQGMVLCACSEDHTSIKLLEPPPSSNPGDKVQFPGFDGEPATPAQVVKKKYLEKLGPKLRTDETGKAHWSKVPFKIGGENCTAPLCNVSVS